MHICCHEAEKREAIFLQKIEFLEEQAKMDKEQAVKKEEHYNNTIHILQRQSEANTKTDKPIRNANETSEDKAERSTYEDLLQQLRACKEKINE